ncbi:hypothetical protein V8G54_035653 [Vigna mungo]|uniref:Uncharacterized protein n=1 Tax=Vigna mungo TaxID=3915 RepID=A0AAQ3MFP6_VIGMU
MSHNIIKLVSLAHRFPSFPTNREPTTMAPSPPARTPGDGADYYQTTYQHRHYTHCLQKPPKSEAIEAPSRKAYQGQPNHCTSTAQWDRRRSKLKPPPASHDLRGLVLFQVLPIKGLLLLFFFKFKFS